MWHYQIIKYKDHVELVEALDMTGVELRRSGEMVETKKVSTGYTGNLLTDGYEDVGDLVHTLKLMLKDIKHYKPITAKKAGLKYEKIHNKKL